MSVGTSGAGGGSYCQVASPCAVKVETGDAKATGDGGKDRKGG